MSISPIWSVVNHHIQPLQIAQDGLSPLALQVQQILQRDNPNDIPVFLRGSILDNPSPHPQADIDLIVVSTTEKHGIDLGALSRLQRFIDIYVLHPEDNREMVYRTLMHTRSYQVLGPQMDQKSILITSQWLYRHWLLYGVNRLPNVLQSDMPFRLLEMKRLLRCIGLIWYMKYGEISRDLTVCLHWLSQLNPQWGMEMQGHCARLNHNHQLDYDIGHLKVGLSAVFYQLWEEFEGN